VTTAETPRPNPCASCPYRRDVPSGVWAAEEYDKLLDYDGPFHEQATAAFGCHQADGHLCAGWVGHRDPADLLAVRIGVIDGRIDPEVYRYRTDVPLFASGAEAAEHGKRDIAAPSAEARATVEKVMAVRWIRGEPVTFTASDLVDPLAAGAPGAHTGDTAHDGPPTTKETPT